MLFKLTIWSKINNTYVYAGIRHNENESYRDSVADTALHFNKKQLKVQNLDFSRVGIPLLVRGLSQD